LQEGVYFLDMFGLKKLLSEYLSILLVLLFEFNFNEVLPCSVKKHFEMLQSCGRGFTLVIATIRLSSL